MNVQLSYDTVGGERWVLHTAVTDLGAGGSLLAALAALVLGDVGKGRLDVHAAASPGGLLACCGCRSEAKGNKRAG